MPHRNDEEFDSSEDKENDQFEETQDLSIQPLIQFG